MTLSLCASAQAGERIINGSPASPGEYPAQGVLFHNGSFSCGGTLVSNRYFLTAAHCVTNRNTGALQPFGQFSVKLGDVDRDAGEPFTFSALDRNTAYNYLTLDNDSALFTLSTPVPSALAEPMRVIEEDEAEASLWAPGKQSTLIGWGLTVDGDDNSDSQVLLETSAPMRSDADCSAAYEFSNPSFNPATMVCAGDGNSDTCQGDSGGPMMVSDGSFLVLAGLTSWGGPCASDTQPGVYTRLGAPTLNAWVRDRVPMARTSVSDSTVDIGQTVAFSATATHPADPAYFTNLAWDFDSDGTTDAQGANPTHAYPTAGNFIARVRATGAGQDTAVAKVAVNVAQPPVVTPPPPAPILTSPPPPAADPRPRAGLATILTLNKPQVRRGRFKMRINFAQDAPAGNAFIEVFRGRKKIGTARARVRRGGSRQVSVKLTKAGRKLLRRSERKRLKVKVQVRVKRQILGSKTLTIRL
jgi:secreted trypsin-like serine protease